MKQQLLQLSLLLRALDPELCDYLGKCKRTFSINVTLLFFFSHWHDLFNIFCGFSLSDSQDSGSLCFCFRWLLIWFKREFSFEDILSLWEVR